MDAYSSLVCPDDPLWLFDWSDLAVRCATVEDVEAATGLSRGAAADAIRGVAVLVDVGLDALEPDIERLWFEVRLHFELVVGPTGDAAPGAATEPPTRPVRIDLVTPPGSPSGGAGSEVTVEVPVVRTPDAQQRRYQPLAPSGPVLPRAQDDQQRPYTRILPNVPGAPRKPRQPRLPHEELVKRIMAETADFYSVDVHALMHARERRATKARRTAIFLCHDLGVPAIAKRTGLNPNVVRSAIEYVEGLDSWESDIGPNIVELKGRIVTSLGLHESATP
jgi:hypothetical protein